MEKYVSLLSLFQTSLHCNSFRTAVIYCDGRMVTSSITYDQLWEFALNIAQLLQNNDICKEIIGCFMKPGLLVPAMILGILQVFSAFTFIDLKHPSEFISSLLKYVKIRFLLVEEETYKAFKSKLSHPWNVVDNIATFHGKILLLKLKDYFDISQIRTSESPCQGLFSGSEISDSTREIAYVIQTSGTTGEPKVVQVPHQCILPNIVHMRSIFRMSPEDVVLLTSPLTFDPSIIEIFIALSSGAALFIIPDYVKMMPQKLSQIISDNRITVLQATPSLIKRFGRKILQHILLGKKSPLRIMAFGGERCPSSGTLQGWRSPDNKTSFFNLYGITEVSCWATLNHINDVDIQGPDAEIPLGIPLLDTCVELRNDKGDKVDGEGEGQLFVGGPKRWCIINNESPSSMQGTGDWVVRKPDGSLVFHGRQDSVIKYNGRKFSLLSLEKILDRISLISQYSVSYKEDESKIYIFVVADITYSELKKEITKVIEELFVMPPYQIVTVPSIPVTSHGKTDVRALYQNKDNYTERHTREKWMHMKTEEILKIVSSLWQKHTGSTKAAPQKSENFVFSGGSSVNAVHFNAEAEWKLDMLFPLLIDKLLNTTYSAVVSYMLKCYSDHTGNSKMDTSLNLHQSDVSKRYISTTKDLMRNDVEGADLEHYSVERYEKSEIETERRTKLHEATSFSALDNTNIQTSVTKLKNINSDNSLEYIGTQDHSKGNNAKKGTSIFKSVTGENVDPIPFVHKVIRVMPCCKVSSRRGKSSICNCKQCGIDELPCLEYLKSEESCELTLSLCSSWKYDLSKCIDASPLLVQYKEGDSVVFIGSHSGTFAAIDLIKGSLFWTVQLSDRIESSACISSCGCYVMVGCYDHYLYCFNVSDGKLHWKFKTDAEVKSSPVVDHNNNCYCGSHDHYLYAAKVKNGQLLWKTKIGEGSIFSSPAVSTNPFLIYAACLDGSVAAVFPDTGKVMHSYKCSGPVFSSPLVYSGGVCVGCVNGEVFHWNHQGSTMPGCHTGGPVFSSASCFTYSVPCSYEKTNSLAAKEETVFIIGSHDNSIYCFSTKLLWKFTADSSIYATPFPFGFSTEKFSKKRPREFSLRTYIAAASSQGVLYILDAISGKLIISKSLPGEIFSSTVVIDNYLVVGCRDNKVYCFKIL